MSSSNTTAPNQQHPTPPRPSINVHMLCCNVYGRIYLTVAGDAYAGHCPRCATPVRIGVSADGSTSQIFRAG